MLTHNIAFDLNMSKILSWFSLFFLIFFCSCQSPEKKQDKLIEVAKELLNQGNYLQVIGMLESEYQQTPLDARALLLLADAHRQEGLWEQAAFHYETLIDLEPQDSELIRLCAMCWEHSNELTKSIHFYKLYLKKEPNQLDAWVQLGNLQTNKKDYSGALESFLKVSKFPNRESDGNLCNRIAALYKILQQPTKAKLWYQKGLQSKGAASLEALLNLIELAWKEKEETTLIRLLKILKQDFPVLQKESVVLEAQKWIEEQLTETNNSTDPENQQTEKLNASLQESSHPISQKKSPLVVPQEESLDMPEGKPFTNIHDNPMPALEAMPPNPVLLDEVPDSIDDSEGLELQEPTFSVLAGKALEKGNYQEAIQQFWKSLNQNPKNSDDWFSLGKAYRLGNDLQKAEIALLQAMQINPLSVPYLLEYLAVIAQTRPSNRAIRQMIQAYDRFPQEPDIILMLANAYKDLADNFREANLYYRKFLELAPQHPKAKDIQILLEND